MSTKRKLKTKRRSTRAQARRAVLTDWRGVDLTPLETVLASTTKPVSSVMPKVLSKIGIDQHRIHAEVLKVWNNLIDGNLVAHAHPTGLRRGTLFVNVDSSVWLNEIVRYRRKEILERLQFSFGRELIARISFRVG